MRTRAERRKAVVRAGGSSWARLFGYDVFISFALGGPPRGSRSYASDLARRLRERGFTVFFSEDEAPVGAQLDPTLQRALLRSRVLVVIANRGTLAEPRWVRTEVEAFRQKRPGRAIVPISIDGALLDPALGDAAQEWLHFRDRIWVDETAAAAQAGAVSDEVVDRLATAPRAVRSATWLRASVTGLLLFFAGLAAFATWQRFAAVEQRDRAVASLLSSAGRQAQLLARDGRAAQGWDELVGALALAQPKVDGPLPDEFMAAALTTRIEDRGGPVLRFDDAVGAPPVREAGDHTPPPLAFDPAGEQIAAAAGRVVGVWSTRDGTRRRQVVLDITTARLSFAAAGTVLVVEGVEAADKGVAGGGIAPAAPAARAIEVATGRIAVLPLALCGRAVPCIAVEPAPARLVPLADLPDFARIATGHWPADRGFVAHAAGSNPAEPRPGDALAAAVGTEPDPALVDRGPVAAPGTVEHEGTSAGRFDLLARARGPGWEWLLHDRETGGTATITTGVRPAQRGQDQVTFETVTVAQDAPRIAMAPTLVMGARLRPTMQVADIVGGTRPGEPPRLRLVREITVPPTVATRRLRLDPAGTLLAYQNQRVDTGPGAGVGRTVVVDLATGAERWSRSEGDVTWGDALVALRENWADTQVLDAATGATWFVTPGQPLAFGARQRMLVMWDPPTESAEPMWWEPPSRQPPPAPTWPHLRLVETAPVRQYARDEGGPASQEGACAEIGALRFLTLTERVDRLWNLQDWHRSLEPGGAATGATAAAAVRFMDTGTARVGQDGTTAWQMIRRGDGWEVSTGEEPVAEKSKDNGKSNAPMKGGAGRADQRLTGDAVRVRWPELSPFVAEGRSVAVERTASADGAWLALMATELNYVGDDASSPGTVRLPVWPECATPVAATGEAPSAVWRIHRRGESRPTFSGCVRGEPPNPVHPHAVRFVAGAPWFSVPVDACRHAVHALDGGRVLSTFMPVFAHEVVVRRASADLLAISSQDMAGTTRALQWQPHGTIVDPRQFGPVMMFGWRDTGEDAVDAAQPQDEPQDAKRPQRAAPPPALRPAQVPWPVLLARDPAAAFGLQDDALSLAQDGAVLRVEGSGEPVTLGVPPWGARMRELLRKAVQARAAGPVSSGR